MATFQEKRFFEVKYILKTSLPSLIISNSQYLVSLAEILFPNHYRKQYTNTYNSEVSYISIRNDSSLLKLYVMYKYESLIIYDILLDVEYELSDYLIEHDYKLDELYPELILLYSKLKLRT